MSQSPPPSGSTSSPTGGGDPWAAFGYIVAGVGLYGLIGWGLGVWLHAKFLTAVGIMVGAALGLALVFYTYGRVPDDPPTGEAPAPHDDVPHEQQESPEPPEQEQTAPHDRGETE